MTRDEVQLDAYNAWIQQGSVGTIIGGTGVGKTRIGIWAVRDELARSTQLFYIPKILWLTNSLRLKEIGTPEDFAKWKEQSALAHIQIETIQTAYKWENTEWDLIVVDEGDFGLTPMYGLIYERNSYKKLLILTATTTPEKTAMYLDHIAPICYQFTTQQAQKLAILNKSQLVFVHYNLSMIKDIKVTYKGGSFDASENSMYVAQQERFLKAYQKLLDLQEDPFADDKAVDKARATLKIMANRRADLLWNSKSAMLIAKYLINLRVAKGHKVISFSKRTEQADKISSYSYHAKNKQNSTIIEDFNKGTLTYFSVVDAINRGENLVGLDTLILESYDSSPTTFQQRHGRGTRLGVDDTLFVYILLPYYKTKDKKGRLKRYPTQAVGWAYEMTKEFDISTAKHINL